MGRVKKDEVHSVGGIGIVFARRVDLRWFGQLKE